MTDREPTQLAPEPDGIDLIYASLSTRTHPDEDYRMPTTESIDQVLCLPAPYSGRQRDADIAAIYRQVITFRPARRVVRHKNYDNMRYLSRPDPTA